MTKNKKILLIAGVAVLVIAVALVLAFCGMGGNANTDPSDASTVGGAEMTYTVEVKSEGGMAMSNVGVYVYEDETLAELVWFDQTDENGQMSFTDAASDSYVAVLSDVPTGYQVQAYYPLTGELTRIVLSAGNMSDVDVEELTYKLGDMMMDFTVTGPDGTEYTLSELLKQKKAVMLNFWYIECEPCKAEFPFLQEAYEKYSDDIAVIAMSPINTSEDIAAFQKENGYTFPMVSCGPEWEKIMQITAYPTTVIIDRYGNISLIHKGTIDNAKTFEDTFAYFTAEEYEQKVIEDIKDLEIEAEEGSQDNPVEIGGQSVFTVEVEPGKEVYTEIYKAKGMYLQIQGKDFYVIYNDNKYTPDKNGIVGFVITTGDNYTPSVFGIGNTGTEKQSYKVALSHLPGTFNNPYSLKMGEFTAKVSAGNDQGVYYRCTAPEDGTYKIQCISSTPGVDYDFSLQSMDVNRTVFRNYGGDGSKENGYPTVTLEMKGGQDVMFSVGTLPDDTNTYPAGTFKFVISFTPGKITEVEKVEMVDYTVTVTDEAGKGIADVAVWLTKDGKTNSARTDAKGVATLKLAKGTYSGSVSVPEGYTLENNAFEVTDTVTSAAVKLAKAIDTRMEYTVKAVDINGDPVAGVDILIIGVDSAVTDANGIATFKLEPGDYSVLTGTLPEGYQCQELLTLSQEQLECTFTLSFVPGSENSPILLLETENTVTNTGTVYYEGYFSGTTMTVTGQTGFSVIVNGQTVADTDGTVSAAVSSDSPRMPVKFAIVGDGEYTVTFVYPEGHQMNPAALVLGQNTATLEAGAVGYYYTWTAPANGMLTVAMDPAAQWVYTVNNVTGSAFGDTNQSDAEAPVLSELVPVTAGDEIQVIVNTYDAADPYNAPAGSVVFDASFIYTVAEVPFSTATVEPGQQLTYQISGVGGTTMTITHANAYVIYNGTTYGVNSEDTVIVEIPESMDTNTPTQLIFGNAGTEAASYSVFFTWPVGHRMNPAELVMGQNTAPVEAGDTDGYCYAWTAPGQGVLTVTMDETAQWFYTVSNTTTGVSSDNHWSDDETPVLSEQIFVSEGDRIQVTVNTYDPADMWNNPAGQVVFQAEFAYVIHEVPFTTELIAPNGTMNYWVYGVDETTLTIESANAYVIYDGTTTGADANGKVTVKIPKSDDDSAPVKLVIGNTGAEAESYQVVFTWPEGSARNPKKLAFRAQNFTARLQAGDDDGYYYTMTANMPGTLTFWTPAPPANVDYTLTLSSSGHEGDVTPAEDDTSRKVSLYVFPDDVLILHVETFPGADGTYPAANIMTMCTFTPDYTTYTVTFDPNGGTLTGAATATTDKGKLSAMPSDPVRADYEFLGWFNAPTGGEQITADTRYSADTTAYAQWNKIEYNVTFNANGGTLTGESTVRTTDYKLAALPSEPALEGYTFNGWFTLPVGGEQITTATVIDGNAEVYAQWTKIETEEPDQGDTPATTLNYEVTVIDNTGAPVTSGVYVIWKGTNTVVNKVINNASGTASATLDAGTYTIMLNFTGDYKNYKYDAASCVATAQKPSITIQIAEPISEDAAKTQYTAGDAVLVTKDVQMGATYVKLNSSQTNYAVVDGKTYCFFRYVITEEGQYEFTTNNGAPITNWGTNPQFLQASTEPAEIEANAFTVNIKESNFPAGEKLPLVFAVEVTDAYADTILRIRDAGDAVYTVYDAAWTTFVSEDAPAYYKDEQGTRHPVDEKNVFHMPSGTITYVDMLTQKAVLGSDGYYHLNSANGPLLYVNLGVDAPKISMYKLLGFEGFGGTLFGRVFFNEDGTPKVDADGNYVKEDYTAAMEAYTIHADPETGAYPLNEDLAYMLQNGGYYKGWYTPGSGSYLFETEITGSNFKINNELAWMFAVFYLK